MSIEKHQRWLSLCFSESPSSLLLRMSKCCCLPMTFAGWALTFGGCLLLACVTHFHFATPLSFSQGMQCDVMHHACHNHRCFHYVHQCCMGLLLILNSQNQYLQCCLPQGKCGPVLRNYRPREVQNGRNWEFNSSPTRFIDMRKAKCHQGSPKKPKGGCDGGGKIQTMGGGLLLLVRSLNSKLLFCDD